MAHVIGLSILMAVGMGNIMAPATESIMGSLPRDKAGVGSAVNDTTRQVGGALGVAIVGSLLSSRYASSLSAALHSVPALAGSSAGARESIGLAHQLAQGLTPAARQSLVAVANTSFTSAMHFAVGVAACFAFIGAIEVLVFLPARAPDDAPATGPAPAGAGSEAVAGTGAREGEVLDPAPSF